MQSIFVFQKTIKNAHTVAHGLFKQGKQSEQLAGVNSAVSAESWHVSFGLRRPQKGSLVKFLVECV